MVGMNDSVRLIFMSCLPPFIVKDYKIIGRYFLYLPPKYVSKTRNLFPLLIVVICIAYFACTP